MNPDFASRNLGCQGFKGMEFPFSLSHKQLLTSRYPAPYWRLKAPRLGFITISASYPFANHLTHLKTHFRAFSEVMSISRESYAQIQRNKAA